jgi:peptidoglycan/LPS O-acetylase OafA/YrhL
VNVGQASVQSVVLDRAARRLVPAEAGGARIASLDGLRAISILAVIFAHLLGTQNFLPANLSRTIGDFGNLGVRVFFIISGYLITSLLFQEAAKTGRISLKGFYLRRTFRIFPAFYCYLAILAIIGALGVIPLGVADVLHAATYTVNYVHGRSWYIGHLWSLSVEEQFYLLWPAALLLLPAHRHAGGSAPSRADIAEGKRRGAVVIAIAVIGVAPFARIGTWTLLPAQRSLIGEAFPTIADAIAFGCLLSGLREQLGQRAWYTQFLGSRWFFLVPVAVLGLNRFAGHVRLFYSFGETLLDLLIALSIDHAVRFPAGRSGRFLNSRVMTYIGGMSYSLYLWQQPFLQRSSSAFVHSFPVNLIATAAAALLSYYLIERPLLRLRVRLFERRPTEASPKVAVSTPP